MATLAPGYTIRRLDHERELHFALRGLISLELSRQIQSELLRECKLLGAGGGSFDVLGDLTECPVQTREVSDQIKLAHEAAPALGMKRLALIGASVLLQQQYKRVRGGVSLEFFDTKTAALQWLRGEHADATPTDVPA